MTTSSTPGRDPRRVTTDRTAPASDEPVITPVDDTPPAHSTTAPTAREDAVRHDVVAREREEFGGFKFGSAFFGWLTAMGAALLLTALVSAAGTAIGLGATPDLEEAADAVRDNIDTVGIIGAIALAVVIFVAYFAGGYVAGRMARFSGAKQGLAVWLWAVIIAAVVALVVALTGSRFNILADLNAFPRIPLDEGDLTTVGIITAVVVAIVSLGGAVLGGLAGMRYHRRVDRAGFAGLNDPR